MKYKDYIPDIYKADPARNLRFVLGNNGQNPLICIGINPNTANNEISDPTMNQLVELYQEKKAEMGYDSCIMLNPYPLICSKPELLPSGFDEEISEENIRMIKECFEIHKGCDVLVMWGDFILSNKDFKNNVLTILSSGIAYEMHFICLRKLSNSGNPYHLQYILRSYNRDRKKGIMTQKYELIDFDAEAYIVKISDKAVK